MRSGRNVDYSGTRFSLTAHQDGRAALDVNVDHSWLNNDGRLAWLTSVQSAIKRPRFHVTPYPVSQNREAGGKWLQPEGFSPHTLQVSRDDSGAAAYVKLVLHRKLVFVNELH